MILVGKIITNAISKFKKSAKPQSKGGKPTTKDATNKPNPIKKSAVSKIANSLPKNPDDLLKKGWKEVTHPEQGKRGSRQFINSKKGLTIRFDRAEAGKPGWRGKDHYHIYNPNKTNKRNQYLDKNGNPVPKNHPASHIKPSVEPTVKQKFQNIKELKQSNQKLNSNPSNKSLEQKLGHLKQSSPSTSSQSQNNPTASNTPTPNN